MARRISHDTPLFEMTLLKEKGVRLPKESVLGAARAYASGDRKPLLRMICGPHHKVWAQAAE